mmetsp:Transcript_19353/g.31934  ORF Transcript_19353/g.31934 Transcript_19353/m.31934 type:complete len:444 (+) Transcript_19353:119-1450(+)
MGCGASKVPNPHGKHPKKDDGSEKKPNRKRYLRLTYRSMLRRNVGIDDIIRKANMKNDRLDIAGALWYNEEENSVRQILEGERDAVRKLFNTISKDPRHYDIVVEIEEYPLRRAYKKWGGMAFSESPDFNDKNKTLGADLCKVTAQYKVSPKQLKEYLDNVLDDEDYIDIGRVFYCRNETGEVLERLEGDRATVEYLLRTYETDHWIKKPSWGEFEQVQKRDFHVFSTKDIARFASSDDSVKRIKFNVGYAHKFQASMYNGFDIATGAIQAVVMFREVTSAKHVVDSTGSETDLTLFQLEEACLNSIRATPQVNNTADSKRQLTSEASEKMIKEIPGITLDYTVMHPPLGFTVRRNKIFQDAKQDGDEKTVKIPKAIVIPTSNTEIRKLVEGKQCSLICINDVNVAYETSANISKMLRKACEKFPVHLKINLRKEESKAEVKK